MKEQDIQGLLKKLTSGTLSETERRQLEAWYEVHGAEGIQQRMDTDWEQTSDTVEIPEGLSWEKFKTTIPSTTTDVVAPMRRLRTWAAVAASIAILIVAGLSYLQYSSSAPRMVEFANASFEQKRTVLPDGSVVWLNANSRIAYAKPFGGKLRAVRLQGEAFFEVATDSLRPFIVKTDLVETKVLGTTFNVKAAAELVEVALVTGKVQVRYSEQDSLVLQPGQQFAYNQQTQQGTTQVFIGDVPYAWKDGILYFYKDNVQEVTNLLQEWYDVTFIIEDDTLLQTELVHRVDTKKRTLEQVLEQISRVADYTFEMKTEKEIIVRPKIKK